MFINQLQHFYVRTEKIGEKNILQGVRGQMSIVQLFGCVPSLIQQHSVFQDTRVFIHQYSLLSPSGF